MSNEILNKHLKKFFSFPGVQKAVNEDNFDEVFKAWDRYRDELRKEKDLSFEFNNLLTYKLCSFLEEANIDWLNVVTKIPNYAFWYYPKSSISLSNNIKEIGNFCFKKSFVDTINYSGTRKEWKSIYLGAGSLIGKDDKRIRVLCSDGDIL